MERREREIHFSTERFFCITPIEPKNPGHLLLIPKRHVTDAFEMNDGEYRDFRVARALAKAHLRERYGAKNFNIGENCGEAAGQTVFHAHIHVVPRFAGDIVNPAGGVLKSIPWNFPHERKRRGPLVYFARPSHGARLSLPAIQAMLLFIKNDLGIPVFTERLAACAPCPILTERFGGEGRPLSANDIEAENIARLDDATHLIAEISFPSTEIGREIEYARTKGMFGKPHAEVLCLYSIDLGQTLSPMILGMTSEHYPNVFIRGYSTIEETKAVVRTFLDRMLR